MTREIRTHLTSHDTVEFLRRTTVDETAHRGNGPIDHSRLWADRPWQTSDDSCTREDTSVQNKGQLNLKIEAEANTPGDTSS